MNNTNTLSNNQICSLTLGDNISFMDDTIQVFIDIKSMSKQLKKQIYKEIDEDKMYYSYYLQNKLNGRKWSKDGVNIVSTTLVVSISKVKDVHFGLNSLVCYIDVDYVDKTDPDLYSHVSINANFSNNECELKQLILNALIDRFF